MNNTRVNAGPSKGETGYHGNWTQTDEHVGDIANSWMALDNLVIAAHAGGTKVYVDLRSNHSNVSAQDIGGWPVSLRSRH